MREQNESNEELFYELVNVIKDNAVKEEHEALFEARFNEVIRSNTGFLSWVDVKHDLSLSLLHYSVLFDNFFVTKLLLNNKISTEIEGKSYNETPLILALSMKKEKIASILIEYNSNVNARDKNGTTCLMYAIYYIPDLVPVLFSRGAEIEAKENQGLTALMIAISQKNEKVALFLIENKANVNSANNEGETPLFYAIRTNNIILVEKLILKGADVNARNNDGYTVLSVAIEINNFEIIDILFKNGVSFNDDYFQFFISYFSIAQKIDPEIFNQLQSRNPVPSKYVEKYFINRHLNYFGIILLKTLLHRVLTELADEDRRFEIFKNIISIALVSDSNAIEHVVSKSMLRKSNAPHLSHNLSQNPLSSRMPSESFLSCFSNFPTKELWRLFYDVDKQRHVNDQGWVNQERVEAGFFSGMCHGLIYLKNTIDEPLTADLLEELHSKCVSFLKRPELDKFRKGSVDFGLRYLYNTSVDGVIEITRSNYCGNHYDFRILYRKRKHLEGFLCTINLDCFAKDDLKEDVEKVILNYETELNAADQSIKKLLAIAKLIGTLIRLHPFLDANCRTICTLLTMRELIRNGFPPAILDDPNRMAGFSSDECVIEMIEGMKNYERIIKLEWSGSSDDPTIGKRTGDILSEIKDDTGSVKLWEQSVQLFKENGIGFNSITTPVNSENCIANTQTPSVPSV